MTIAKLFALHANAKKECQLQRFLSYSQTQQDVDDNLRNCELNHLLVFSTLSSLVAISLVKKEYTIFKLSRDFSRTRYQRIQKLYRQEPLKLSQHPSSFSSHRDCGSSDIMVLVCHVISPDHQTKASRDFLGKSYSK